MAYNRGNFLHTLATPDPLKDWSPTTLNQPELRAQSLSRLNLRHGQARGINLLAECSSVQLPELRIGRIPFDRSRAAKVCRGLVQLSCLLLSTLPQREHSAVKIRLA